MSEIDYRLATMFERYKFSLFKFWDEVAKTVNSLAESEKLGYGYTTMYELNRIPKKAVKLIKQLREEHNSAVNAVGAGEPIV